MGCRLCPPTTTTTTPPVRHGHRARPPPPPRHHIRLAHHHHHAAYPPFPPSRPPPPPPRHLSSTAIGHAHHHHAIHIRSAHHHHHHADHDPPLQWGGRGAHLLTFFTPKSCSTTVCSLESQPLNGALARVSATLAPISDDLAPGRSGKRLIKKGDSETLCLLLLGASALRQSTRARS